jgi:hypothetical protein
VYIFILKDRQQFVSHQWQQQLFQVLQSSEQNYRCPAHAIKEKVKTNSRKHQSSVKVVVPGPTFY